MKQLAGNNVSNDFLKGIWLKKLRNHAQTILVSKIENIDNLLISADQIIEIRVPNIPVNAVSSNSEISSLEQKVEILQKQIENLLHRSWSRD